MAETAEKGVPLALPRQAHGLEAPGPQPKGNDLLLAPGAGHTLTSVLMLPPRTPATLQESWETRLFPDLGSCRRREEGGKKKELTIAPVRKMRKSCLLRLPLCCFFRCPQVYVPGMTDC